MSPPNELHRDPCPVRVTVELNVDGDNQVGDLTFYSACAVYNCTEFEMSPVSSTTSPVGPVPPPTCFKTANDGRPVDAVRNLDGNGDNCRKYPSISMEICETNVLYM